MKSSCALGVVLLAAMFVAQQHAVIAQTLQQEATPLERLLNPDGTVNTSTGFSGSLDVTGWQMSSGPDGAPRFQPGAGERLLLPEDSLWDYPFDDLGMNGVVRALAVLGTDLYAGGEFTKAGGGSANFVAKWNGVYWSALGSGMNGTVRALAVLGTDLYAGGDFITAGGVSANRIAKWDGTAWSALGSGMSHPVYALAVMGTDLYAGGDFSSAGGVTVHGVARWNGSIWSALGTPPGLNGYVRSLAVIGTSLYAGGMFVTTTGGVTVNHIARWNGSNWSSVGTGMDSPLVTSLAVMGTTLHAGGSFRFAGGVFAPNVAKWNGATWSAIDGVVGHGTNDVVNALTVIGTDLYIGGQFSGTPGGPARRIVRWNGATWDSLSSGMNSPVFALAGLGTELCAGGAFTTSGGGNTNRIARWNGTGWFSLGGTGLNGRVWALAVMGNDLYVGGEFSTAGGIGASRIAKWDGMYWSPLGSGMNEKVWALAVVGTDLYAGGEFTTAGGVAASCIARWDGSSWHALGSGTERPVYALCAGGTDLYVGGQFDNAGGAGITRIAKWNGTSWSALGSGVNSNVYSLAYTGTDLYAGGEFWIAGGNPALTVAKWNGTSWSALGSGLAYPVVSLAAIGADLYVGCSGGLYKWNGTSFSSMAAGWVWDLTVVGTALYAGGKFTPVGGVGASRIGRWDGSSWSALGSDADSTVFAIAVMGNDLYVGGDFTTAGGKPSPRIARWIGERYVPSFVPDPPSLAFGSLAMGDSLSDSVKVRNDRLVSLEIFSATSTTADFHVAPASAVILPGDSAWFTVSFTPTAPGSQVAGIAFVHNADTSPDTVSVSGTGMLFTEEYAGSLTGLDGSSADWGDYDNDGHLDLFLSGWTGTTRVSRIYRNTGSGFTEMYAGSILPTDWGSAGWVDYNNDGMLDILVTGAGDGRLYRNTGSGFTPVWIPPGTNHGSACWGDYNNDGRLDLLLTGLGSGGEITQLWRNTGTGFTTVGIPAPPVVDGAAAWGDYDNDGRLDFVLTGYTGSSRISQIWHNTGSGFSMVFPGLLPPVSNGSAAWADFNGDGLLDLVLAGYTGTTYVAYVYRNAGAGFVEYQGLPGTSLGSAAWGDYDNDGRPDIILTGSTGSLTKATRLFRNTVTGFSEVTADSLPDLTNHSASTWGDYDNDGDLDLVLSGFTGTPGSSHITRLYRNNTIVPNTAPAAPTGLVATAVGDSVRLRWQRSTDAEGPANGLGYNLRLGSNPSGINTVSPMAEISTGWRRVVLLGNAFQDTAWTIRGLSNGTYHWSVQAIDQAFAGSPFATETSFSLLPGFSATPGALSFGEVRVGESATDSVVVKNTGTVTLILDSSRTSGGEFTVAPLGPETIGMGDSALVVVTFSPTTPGTQNGILVFFHNAESSPDTVTLGGTGVEPGFSVAPPGLAFGDVPVGALEIDSVLVKNTGTAPLAVDSARASGGEFSVLPPGPEVIGAGDSAWFSVLFSPTSTGLQNGQVVFFHDASSSPDTVSMSGRGADTTSHWFLSVSPDTIIAKDPIKGKFLKPVKRAKPGKPIIPPNWANLLDETVAQGGFQPGASESDSAGGMVIGASHMYLKAPLKWAAIKDSAAVRAWVRLTKWDFKKSIGKSFNALQKTLETKAGKHDLMPARGFDFTTDGKNKPLVKQMTKLDPKKQDNALFGEMVALKLNIAASALGKIPTGFGDLLFDRNTSGYDEQSVLQIAAAVDQMMTYWQLFDSSDFADAYTTVYDINRAFVGPLDTAVFIAGNLVLVGQVEITSVPYLKVPTPFIATRLEPTTTEYESLEDFELDDEEFEGGSVPVAAKLYQNYPNPFNPGTTISFRLLESSQVTIRIYDMLGQVVATLLTGEEMEEGYNEVRFNADGLSSGVYFYQIDARGLDDAGLHSIVTNRMLLLK